MKARQAIRREEMKLLLPEIIGNCKTGMQAQLCHWLGNTSLFLIFFLPFKTSFKLN